MIIGVPREIWPQEGRVGVSPSTALRLVRQGHSVIVQQGAGKESGFLDDEYIRAGVELVATIEDIYARAALVWKVEAPTGLEPRLLREGQVLFCFLHSATRPDLHAALSGRGIRLVAAERIRLEGGVRPVLRPMSEVAGRMALQVGARCLERSSGGRGILLGGIPGVPPARVAIFGIGVVGWNAMRAAVGLGAEVLVLDQDPDRLRPVDDAMAGRVRTLHGNPTNVEEALIWADLVIGSVRSSEPSIRAPILVARDQLGLLQPGAVVVDVAIDEGGCFETSHVTTHQDSTFEVDGVLHYAVPNMPGAVPRTSTPALAQAMLEYGMAIADLGLDAAARARPALQGAILA